MYIYAESEGCVVDACSCARAAYAHKISADFKRHRQAELVVLNALLEMWKFAFISLAAVLSYIRGIILPLLTILLSLYTLDVQGKNLA